MVFAINLSILDDLVKADRPMLNRCLKENPYSFRKKRYCCSRPVDFQWKKDGYCYGKTQRCSHEEGCENCEYKVFFLTISYLFSIPINCSDLKFHCSFEVLHLEKFEKKCPT